MCLKIYNFNNAEDVCRSGGRGRSEIYAFNINFLSSKNFMALIAKSY